MCHGLQVPEERYRDAKLPSNCPDGIDAAAKNPESTTLLYTGVLGIGVTCMGSAEGVIGAI